LCWGPITGQLISVSHSTPISAQQAPLFSRSAGRQRGACRGKPVRCCVDIAFCARADGAHAASSRNRHSGRSIPQAPGQRDLGPRFRRRRPRTRRPCCRTARRKNGTSSASCSIGMERLRHLHAKPHTVTSGQCFLWQPKPQHQVRLIDTPPSTSSAAPVMNDEAPDAM